MNPSDAFHALTPTAHDGQSLPLADLRGRAVLVVNIASQCGFTPQLAALEALWQAWRERGLTVLGFPCNQFGGQTPQDSQAMAGFCQINYGVTFPLLAKGDVYGPQADPLFSWLTAQAPGVLGRLGLDARPRWNFTKFLVSPDAAQVRRFAPWTSPARIAPVLERWLGGA
ncbi:glutathione peroxidase [Amphibiibacter pelophylacis]|uniref:Glutathione peroxidase n=1 Tax=Amphibiibacter pelophylacis TaxID=1799477 RepID=A0ACC6P397_9BURK